MSQEPPQSSSRRHSLADPADLSTLSAAVNNTYDRLDELTELARRHYQKIAPPRAETPQPTTADGTSFSHHSPDITWVRHAALIAAEGLTVPDDATSGPEVFFNDASTNLLADLGRDLRKDGITIDHLTAITESLIYALCTLHNQSLPGSTFTQPSAEQVGLPRGLIELLEIVDLGVRIVALGAADDEDAGIPPASGAEVLGIQRRSPRVTVVRLAATPPHTGWAGQTLEVRYPANPDTWRQIASAIAPNPGGLLEFAIFHPADQPLAVDIGEHWVVANPTGGLEIPYSDQTSQAGVPSLEPVLILALNEGISAARALILDAANRPTTSPIYLYWQADHHADLHEYSGFLSLTSAFSWLTIAPVLTTPITREADAVWFADPENALFHSYSHPDAAQREHGLPLRQGTAVELAIADGAHHNATILISGDPSNPSATRNAIAALIDAGVSPERITAQPR